MSSFGSLFRVSTFGESHCISVGCIVEGVPPRIKIDQQYLQSQLDRRRPGQSSITTQRKEEDKVIILSGLENDYTLGTPIGLMVKNLDQRPGDYKLNNLNDIPRPSHGDLTYQLKYGIRSSSGGGRASARETISRVAAGTIAELWLSQCFNTSILAYVSSVGNIKIENKYENMNLTREMIDSNIVRCPDQEKALEMRELVEELAKAKDSVGGVVTCIIKNCPIGIGEPVFDKLEAKLAHAMLSIPATKGFEIGSGFEGAKMRGSEHNDLFVAKEKSENSSSTLLNSDHTMNHNFSTITNNSGGVQAGISNGENIVIRIAFKPPATIGISQTSSSFQGDNNCILEAKGRHDPCVVPRAIPIVEAMAALVIADLTLIQLARIQAAKPYPIIGKVDTNSNNSNKNENKMAESK